MQQQQEHDNHHHHRYIPPIISTSLVSDAPGYGTNGPICWKCRGQKVVRSRYPKHQKHTIQSTQHNNDAVVVSTSSITETTCPVCIGNGRLNGRKIDESIHPGKITRGRRRRRQQQEQYGATVSEGPDPIGYTVPYYGSLVQKATNECIDIIFDENVSSKNDTNNDDDMIGTDTTCNHHSNNNFASILNHLSVHKDKQMISIPISPISLSLSCPIWIPRPTEELCNLTGTWRILQRVQSHRWTTDDLVTAMVASKEMIHMLLHTTTTSTEVTPIHGTGTTNNTTSSGNNIPNNGITYCDLGTGNGSVLQMVVWKLMSANIGIENAIGLEARSEAVSLAKRSLQFNVGEQQHSPPSISIIHTDFRSYCTTHMIHQYNTYDLITGTPPYFRVDFDIQEEDDGTSKTNPPIVHHATIRQGGMPTSIQSAPARCEFRGGFEEYCTVAKLLLKPNTGIFCICENYLNHQRAMSCIASHNLILTKLYKIAGKVGRETLFCVYVLQKLDDVESLTEPITIDIAVRGHDGDWTEEYCTLVLKYMSIST